MACMSMAAIRAQRAMMATLLIIALVLMHLGYSWGEYIIWFIIFMLIFSAITGICPSDAVFSRLFPYRGEQKTA